MKVITHIIPVSSLHFLYQSSALTRTAALFTLVGTALLFSTAAQADDGLPTGGQVVGGAADINYVGADRLNVSQHSDRTVINWQDFNIDQGKITEFFQPGAGSLAVNRVTRDGADPTRILGTLKANGRVMVLDRNGVVFGPGSRVDVAGIVVSTGDVHTAAVMNGDARLELAHFGNGSVINEGDISVADGGLAALVAPSVRNSGTITAKLGKVALASGDRATVDLYGDNLVELALDSKATKAVIDQTGSIDAEGGSVQIATATAKDVVDNVINMDGVTRVSSVTVEGGKIVLSGDTINVRGTLDADGTKGGKITTYANKTLNVTGSITARGADKTGFVDTSGEHLNLDEQAIIRAGLWLIDPPTVIIRDTNPAPGNGYTVILTSLLEAQLASGDVLVKNPAIGAGVGNIRVHSVVDWFSTNSLTLEAFQDIHFEQGGGLNAGGGGDVILTALDDIRLQDSALSGTTIFTNGGDITFTADEIGIRPNKSIDAAGGDILFNNPGGLLASPNSIRTSGTGTVTIRQTHSDDGYNPLTDMPNTIQGAIDAIQNSGTGMNTVSVGAGEWLEDVHNSGLSNLTLLGAQAEVDPTVLGSRASTTGETLIKPTSTGITLMGGNDFVVDGFWIDGQGSAGTGIHGIGNDNLTIVNNVVNTVTRNGIFIEETANSLVDRNVVATTGLNGISVVRSLYNDAYQGEATLSRVALLAPYTSNATDFRTVITNNTVSENGENAIHTENIDDVEVGDNSVTGAAESGVHMGGSLYGHASIYGNTVTDSTVGMTFESGLIDLTGTANTLTGGQIGYRFAPVGEYDYYDYGEGYGFVGFSDVDLVDNTIGTTFFSGQSTFFVELLNTALFDPGAPTLENGLDSTYVTPFGTITPASTGGIVTNDQFAFLENMFWHYPDDSAVGLFFFGTGADQSPDFADEDVFNNFGRFAGQPGGANITILGLPGLPGGGAGGGTTAGLTLPEFLNQLTPAAGGDGQDENNGDQVAQIEPAAGQGTDAACWSDAIARAGQGQTVNYNLTTNGPDILSDTVACGNQPQ